MIAGTTPFAGADLATTVRRILTSPPPRLDRANVPTGLNRVLTGPLAKAPGDRPVTMLEFAEQLRDVERRNGFTVTPIPRLAAGISGGVGTIDRPPDVSGPVVISTQRDEVRGATASNRPPVADATIARARALRNEPVMRTGDADEELDEERRRTRRRLSAAAGAVAIMAIVLGVFMFGRGGDDDPDATVVTTNAPPPTDPFFAVLQPPGELIVSATEDGTFTVSYEMPASATEVEIEIVSGSATGERSTGTGAPIEIRSDGATLCVVARSLNDTGQVSNDAGPVCAG